MTIRMSYISVNDEIIKYFVCPVIALLRAQSLILDKPDGETEDTEVVLHARSAGIEAEVPRIVGVLGRRRPIVAEGPHADDTSVAIAEARGGQHNGIAVGTRDLVSTSVPRPLALGF